VPNAVLLPIRDIHNIRQKLQLILAAVDEDSAPSVAKHVYAINELLPPKAAFTNTDSNTG